MIKMFIALFVFLGTGTANADVACSDLVGHASQRACLEARAADTESRLATSEEALARALDGWDQDADYRRQAKALLSASTKAFERFVAQQCDFEASLAAGGNGAGDMRLDCRIRQMEDRIRWAMNWRKELAEQSLPNRRPLGSSGS